VPLCGPGAVMRSAGSFARVQLCCHRRMVAETAPARVQHGHGSITSTAEQLFCNVLKHSGSSAIITIGLACSADCPLGRRTGTKTLHPALCSCVGQIGRR
jgi:hypothetical protein